MVGLTGSYVQSEAFWETYLLGGNNLHGIPKQIQHLMKVELKVGDNCLQACSELMEYKVM